MSAVVSRRTSVTWIVILWSMFVVAHAVVAMLGWTEPNQPRGDVYNVYEPWSLKALSGGGIVGVTEEWVYPPLALVPMVFAHLFAPFVGYQWGWVVVVVLLNAGAFAFLVGRGQSVSRRWVAGFWMVFIFALGPISMYRLDSITVPICVAAILVVRAHPVVASVLLAMAAWMKIWPGALLLAAFAALERKRAYVIGTLSVSAVVAGVVALGGGITFLFGFLSMQSSRGLQAESVFATPFLWDAVMGVPGSGIYYDAEIITYQVHGDTQLLSTILTPLLLIVGVAIAALGFIAHRNGVTAKALMPPLGLALVLTFIVFNKVGSPQFQTWLIAPVALWLLWDRRRALPYAVTAVIIALATHLLYPFAYDKFLMAEAWMITVISARNILLVALLIGATIRVGSLVLNPKVSTHLEPTRK